MILDSVNKKIQIVLAAPKTTNDCPYVVDWREINQPATTYTPASGDGTSNGTTSVDVVSAPATNYKRAVKSLIVRNADTAAVSLSVIYNDNGTLRIEWQGTLSVGDVLQWTDHHGFTVIDDDGNLKYTTASTVAVSGAVQVSGSVSLLGTPTVALSGTPLVSVVSGLSVTARVSGTVQAQISGTVPVVVADGVTVNNLPLFSGVMTPTPDQEGILVKVNNVYPAITIAVVQSTVTVDGNVNILNLPANWAVSGTVSFSGVTFATTGIPPDATAPGLVMALKDGGRLASVGQVQIVQTMGTLYTVKTLETILALPGVTLGSGSYQGAFTTAFPGTTETGMVVWVAGPVDLFIDYTKGITGAGNSDAGIMVFKSGAVLPTVQTVLGTVNVSGTVNVANGVSVTIQQGASVSAVVSGTVTMANFTTAISGTVQPLNSPANTQVFIYVTQTAFSVATTLLMTVYTGVTQAGAGLTNYVVPGGKTLRLLGVHGYVQNSITTTPVQARVLVGVSTGAVTATATVGVAGGVNIVAANASQPMNIAAPMAADIAAGQTIGILGTVNTSGTVGLAINGYLFP